MQNRISIQHISSYTIIHFIILVMAVIYLPACTPPASPNGLNSSIERVPSEEHIAIQKTTIHVLFIEQTGYQENDITNISNDFNQKNPGIEVLPDFVTYEALHDKIVTAAAKPGSYDVFLTDSIWLAEFANAGFIMDLTDHFNDEIKRNIWPAVLQAVTYHDKIYAMPWTSDMLMLYLNEDMLNSSGFKKPPTTWSELEEMGMAARDKKLLEYPFIEYFQQGEGLTIAFNYYLSSFGGRFFDAKNKPTFNSAEGQAALDFMVNGMKEKLYDPASLDSTYAETGKSFSQGSSAFVVNWSYLFNMVEDEQQSLVAGKIKVASLPGETSSVSTIFGGMTLAISADSQHPEEAWKFIQYLTRKDIQKRFAKKALPIWMSLYDDTDLIAEMPQLINTAKQSYLSMQNRPQVPFYSEATKIIAREIQAALKGSKSSEQALKDAEVEINNIAGQYPQ